MEIIDQMRELAATAKAEGKVLIKWRLRPEHLPKIVQSAYPVELQPKNDGSYLFLDIPVELVAPSNGVGVELVHS